MTGEYTKYIVGSKSEELFYKVCIALGSVRMGLLRCFMGRKETTKGIFGLVWFGLVWFGLVWFG